MLEDESPTFRGNFYTVLDAMNRPGPVQDGGVPVVVFIESPSELAQVAVSEFVGLADAVIVGGGVDEVRQVVDQVRSVVRQQHHNEGSEIAPLQVIGVGPVSEGPGPHDPRPGQAAASAAAWAVESVRDLFGAGVDGCIVPLEMTAPDELLQAIGAGLGAV